MARRPKYRLKIRNSKLWKHHGSTVYVGDTVIQFQTGRDGKQLVIESFRHKPRHKRHDKRLDNRLTKPNRGG